MPIVNNISDSIGDEFLVKFNPIRGVLEIGVFNDSTVGTTVNRYFEKYYRYALRDGLFYTDWILFATGAPLGVTFLEPQIVWFETKYVRSGSDTSGFLTLESIDVDTNYSAMPEKVMPNGFNSILKNLLNDDTQVLQLVKNLLEKLYYRGIVPQYITRGENENGVGDDDYLSFWRAFAQVISTIIVSNEKLKDWEYNEDFLKEYLIQFNIFFDSAKTDLLQSRYLMQHQYNEVKLRSTEHIFKEGGVVDGEFLRLVGWEAIDEMVYWLDYNERRGWVLGQNSPCYKGVSRNPQLNKIPSLSVFRQSTTPPFDANYSVLTYNQKEALLVSMLASGEGALNYYNHGVSPLFSTYQDSFLVDDELDYEISFFIATDDISQKCAFYLHTFDKDWNYSPAFSVNQGGAGVGVGNFEFFLPTVGNYYYFSLTLYNSNRQDYNPLATNTNIGTNFALRKGTKRVLPSFLFDSMGANKNFYLSDVRLNILSKGARLNYENGLGARSNCFLNTNNILNVVARNNNGRYSLKEIERIAKTFLMPYNNHFILDFINKFETETNFGVLPEYIPTGDFNNDFNNDFS